MSIAINQFAVYHSMNKINSGSCEQQLWEHVDFLLTVLPPGTKFLNATPLAIVDLSMRYRIEFEHPLFDGIPGVYEAVTEIKEHRVRVAYKEGEVVKQASLFMKLQYLTADGKDRWSL